MSIDWMSSLADKLEGRVSNGRLWETPGDMAQHLDKRTVQTPALRLIDEKLVQAFSTPDYRLIISMPPQEGKSQRASRRFPLWALQQNPELRIAMASYESTIATRWGRAVRDDIVQNPHLGLTVRSDVSSQAEWQLGGRDGGMFSVGVGGAMTGRAVDCVSGDTELYCEYGTLTAAEAFSRDIKWIRSYDHDSGQVVWGRVEASRRINSRKVVEVHTNDGRVLTCTPDHRIYTGRGYLPAESLVPGETLLGLVDGAGMRNVQTHLSDPEAGPEEGCSEGVKPILQPGVLGAGDGSHPPEAVVRGMQLPLHDEGGGTCVFSGVHGETNLTTETGEGSSEANSHLPSVQRDLSETRSPVLLSGVRGRGPLRSDAPQGELELENWGGVPESVWSHASSHIGEGQSSVRCLPGGEISYRSPLERDHIGQPPRESDHVVPGMPLDTPQVEDVTVSMVQYVDRDDVSVYDFQVEGTSNFFAGEILVHNCLIIDDPIKGREQADSPTIREKTWEWWTDVALTRLAPGAPVIIILTRWHADDLAGRLLAEADTEWDYLNIPAQAEHRPEEGEQDVLGRDPGEYMESARGRSYRQWDSRKKASGPKTWASLYQGHPSPGEGGIFPPPEDWQRYDQPMWIDRPDGSRIIPGLRENAYELIQSWDMTFKDTKSSDFVVGQVWLRVGIHAYLLDQVRERLNFNATVHAVQQLTAKWPQATAKLIEDKANGSAVLDHLSKVVSGMIPVEPQGSKLERASAISPFVFAQNVHLPTAQLLPSVDELLEETKTFPNSPHDDTIDSLSQALSYLLLHDLADQDNLIAEEWAGDRIISPY